MDVVEWIPKKGNHYIGQIVINGVRPLQVSRNEACLALRETRLIQEMLAAVEAGILTQDGTPWLRITREGGRGSLKMIDTVSLEEAFYRVKVLGEPPPRLPSDHRLKQAA